MEETVQQPQEEAFAQPQQAAEVPADEQIEEVVLDEDMPPIEETPVIYDQPVSNDIDYVDIEETLGQLDAIDDNSFAPQPEEKAEEVSQPAVVEQPQAEEEPSYSFTDDEIEDDKFFNSINEILDNVPELNPQQNEPEEAQTSFSLDDDDTSIDDIALAISQMDLNDYDFTEKSEEPVNKPEPQPVKEPEYQPANEVDQPVYYDDPETVSELTEQLHTERELREEMAEQTKQLKLQMSEYENEINDANSSMTKTNKILNFVLTLLILLLFAFLLVIGYWFAQERGLI